MSLFFDELSEEVASPFRFLLPSLFLPLSLSSRRPHAADEEHG